MNEPDWRDRQNMDGASPAMLLASPAYSSSRMEFSMSAESGADASADRGDSLTEVWEYLGKH